MQQIMSFDIGVLNFCYCIEQYNLKKNAIEFGKTVKLVNTNISFGKGTQLNKTVFDNLSTLLDGLAEDIANTNVVLIEKQLPKNLRCLKIEHFLWTWFYIKYPQTKVITYHAKFKTSVFGVTCRSYYQRKNWAVQYAKDVAKKRNDTATILKLMRKKSDDMADCLLMCLSYVIKTYGPTS